MASGRPERPPGMRPEPSEVVEVAVEKLVAGGDGLARWEGLPVFVPRSAPGDRLRVRITESRRDYCRAEIVEVLTPGPGRRTPPCPYFDACGGCDLQHLDDAHQLRYKVAAARETLERLGSVQVPADAEVVAAHPWAYRIRARLHGERRDEGARVGYRERRSHRLVAIERCPILVPELEALLSELPERLRERTPQRLELAAGDGGVAVAPAVAGVPHGRVSRRIGEFDYSFDARCFFQPHGELLPRLVQTVVGEWRGERAFDLYSGVGLFALPLAGRYGRVVAVEGDRVAARYQRINVRSARIGNVETVAHAVETWMHQLPEAAERVVVDPPRPGLGRGVRAALIARRPHRVTYVSCHVATLARDLRELSRDYRLERLAFVDLFPQTGHLETVAQLASLRQPVTR